MKRILAFAVAVFVGFVAAAAYADLQYTQGSGTTLFDFICFATKHCPVHVNINSAGTELFTSGNPGTVQGNQANGAILITPSGTATVSGTVNVTPASNQGLLITGTVQTVGAGGTQTITPTNGSIFAITPTNGSIIAITPVANTLFPITGSLSAVINNVTATIILTSPAASLVITPTGNVGVNVVNSNANGQATMANSQPVVIASNQAAITATMVLTSAGANLPVSIGGSTTLTVTPTNGSIFVSTPTNGSIYVVTPTNGFTVVTTPANGTSQITGTVYVGNANPNGPAISTSGSPVLETWLTPAIMTSLSTPAVVIKSSQGQLGWLSCSSTNVSQTFVEVFNNSSPSVGTTTPTLSIPVPGSITGGVGGFTIPGGINFSSAISIAATAGAFTSAAPVTPLVCNAGIN